MNIISLSRIALVTFTLGTASAPAVFAQTATNAAPTPPAAPTDNGGRSSAAGDTGGGRQSSGDTGGGRQSVLTADEKAQLNKARDAVLAANPDLKTEADNLKQQGAKLRSESDSASDDDRQALKTKIKDHDAKMRAAMLKLDPTLAPIFAKLDAAKSGGRQ
jgi:hypothetical protein